MSTTLTNGLKLPDKGSVDWYADMQSNYAILDGAVGTVAEHTSALSGKAPLVHTHTKSDVTDLFNSANTWTGEQTFSQTIQGNAATASAFDTAKSITLKGAVTGTVSGTNSWEIATVLKTGSARTGGTVTNPYFKIASWEVAPNKYFGAILQIQNKCYPEDVTTLIISVRTKSDATFQRGTCLLDNVRGFTSSDFILLYKEVTGKVLCELYYYTTTPFNGIRFSVISEGLGIQEGDSLFNTMIVYRDPSGVAALPSDYTAIQTSIGTYTQDFIPYSNNTYDLGSASYQWNNLYAKNYYYNGVAWGLDKANVWSAIQTISYAGSNIAIALKHQETNIAASPTRNNWCYINFYDKNSVALGGFNYSKRTNGNSRVYLNLRTKNTNNDIIEKNVFFETNQEGTDWNLYPASNADINLGTSTNKWKSLNGVNPGALSLPNFSSNFDVSGQIVPPSGESVINTQGGKNSFTPTVNGWLSIRKRYATSIKICRETSASFGFNTQSTTEDDLCICSPVIAGTTYTIRIISSTSNNADHFMLAPCQGNV